MTDYTHILSNNKHKATQVSQFPISLRNVTKTYEKGKVMAVNNVSFDVNNGELFGLIGPDGAGKSTIFRILTTLLLADKGNAYVLGLDVVKDFRRIRSEIGYMPGRFSLYQDLTVKENLQFYATLFGSTIEENYYLIKDIYVQIEPFKNRKAGQLSGGMKQKLALCCALIHKPKVLFLDEPTTGIDPVSRLELWQMLRKLKSENISILVSTPYMDEALMCDRIGLIKNGELLTIDTPSELSNKFNKNLFAVKTDNTYNLLKVLQKYTGSINSYAFGEYAHIVSNESKQDLLEFLQHHQFNHIEIKEITPTIEDCFIDLSMNKNL